jgi:hypothetical protein
MIMLTACPYGKLLCTGPPGRSWAGQGFISSAASSRHRMLDSGEALLSLLGAGRSPKLDSRALHGGRDVGAKRRLGDPSTDGFKATRSQLRFCSIRLTLGVSIGPMHGFPRHGPTQ